MDVTGKTAVITGASRGIGAGLAQAFFAQGMKLGLCARSEPVITNDERVVAGQLDVTDEAALDGFVDRVVGAFGRIDLWINNAGVLDPIAPLRDVAVADLRRHLDVNITGVFLGTRAFARHVRARDGGGVLVNISSGAGRHPYAGWSAYCAGKAAVDRLTECVQLEEADAGLRAYAVAPGVIDTAMQELIRGCTAEQFPQVERFRQMKADDSFSSVEHVAREMLALAFGPPRDDVLLGFDAGR
jgi:NAD(P)-dependent dehydrogenase (short-subunit alcohol dehydrogenase family)